MLLFRALVFSVLFIAPIVLAPAALAQEPVELDGLTGLTMEEVAEMGEPRATTPEEALRLLREGNARFYSNTAQRPELDAFERRAQIITQTPFAAVLGCSDSRVPLEIVYDQGLGDLFAVRVAGNVVTPATSGSIEYAVEHLDTHLVVVMGHEGCGAVKAAMLPLEDQRREPESIQYLLDRVRPSLTDLPDIRDEKARLREAVIRNVRAQMAAIQENEVVQEAAAAGTIRVVGAYYEISSGAVDFILPDGETMGSLHESELPTWMVEGLHTMAATHDNQHPETP